MASQTARRQSRLETSQAARPPGTAAAACQLLELVSRLTQPCVSTITLALDVSQNSMRTPYAASRFVSSYAATSRIARCDLRR